MDFQQHTSQKLVSLFKQKPYQGKDPEKSRIIFLSSDANYSSEISEHKFFNFILEYQADGVAFWKKYGVHHPFLLNEYPFDKRKDGVVFHRNFKSLGLDASYSGNVCFIELLDTPTIGTKSTNLKTFYSMAAENHLKYLDKIINDSSGRLIFASSGVIKNMLVFNKMYGVFNWLKSDKIEREGLCAIGSNQFRKIPHFSSANIHGHIEIIKYDIDKWLSANAGLKLR